MDVLNLREVCTRKPFVRVRPEGYGKHGMWRSMVSEPKDELRKDIVTQADFMREYFVTGHKIFDKAAYPDIIKEDPDNPGKWYTQPITRIGFAFQQLITTKHTIHLIGNDVQFEIITGGSDSNTEELQNLMLDFRKGWLTADMEIRMYEAVHSWLCTGDAAVVGFIKPDGSFGAKTLSYENGDTLYPHFDSVTGELELFARKYYDYNDEGNAVIEWLEVWDKNYLYRYKRDLAQSGVIRTVINKLFSVSGYSLVSQKKHGFPFVPISYCRNEEGACWSSVQGNIEDYEEAFSYLCESNKAYAFPIFYVKGDGNDINIQGDMNGSVKAISMTSSEDDAGFLNGTDASNAFATQLDKSYKLIYELSSTVQPPELKSGDLPGVAVKLLFSPAIEVAMRDAQKLQPFLRHLVKIVKFGWGYENNEPTKFDNLNINAYIEPYIHQNETELVTNIATAVQNNFLSHQTASEKCPRFPTNDEYKRIIMEEKEKQEQDLLMDIQKQDAQTQNNIEEDMAQAKINKMDGSDINTGHGSKGGRPNLSGRSYDANRNWDGRYNWDKFDQKTVK